MRAGTRKVIILFLAASIAPAHKALLNSQWVKEWKNKWAGEWINSWVWGADTHRGKASGSIRNSQKAEEHCHEVSDMTFSTLSSSLGLGPVQGQGLDWWCCPDILNPLHWLRAGPSCPTLSVRPQRILSLLPTNSSGRFCQPPLHHHTWPLYKVTCLIVLGSPYLLHSVVGPWSVPLPLPSTHHLVLQPFYTPPHQATSSPVLLSSLLATAKVSTFQIIISA